MTNAEWKESKFKELYLIPSKNGVSKPSRVRGNGFKMINMGELFSHDRIYDIPMELVPLTEAEQISAKVEPFDLLFARQSLVAEGAGKCDIVMEVSPLTVFESHLIRVRLNQKLAYPPYFYYYFKSPFSPVKRIIQHCVQAGIKASDLAEVTVKYPPLAEQQRIAKILSSIDDKIELNNAINRNLEEQAQAIFKSWFVDFESFGGKMPEDWKLGKLGDVAEIKKKAFHPEKNLGLIVEHYSLPALDEKHYPVFEVADGIKSNKFVVSKESVLISKLNPDTKRIWRPYCISENPICSTEFVVFESINGSHRDFLYSIIDSQQFYDFMGSLVTGCTNSHQRVSPETLLTFPIAIPPKTILKPFCDKITPIYEMIEKNVLENQRLANLRDSTLPKLMSGEIDSDKIAV